MRRMAEDLDTTLDWVAVDHHDTGHPHTHIVLRGKDERRRPDHRPGISEPRYRRRLDLVSGRSAPIEKSREFVLAPVASGARAQSRQGGSGIPHGDTISWTLGRQRSGPNV